MDARQDGAPGDCFGRILKRVFQEELADRISGLRNTFKSEEEKAMYIKAMFICLSKEWHKIDRWRMDKFLMVRVFLTPIIIILADEAYVTCPFRSFESA